MNLHEPLQLGVLLAPRVGRVSAPAAAGDGEGEGEGGGCAGGAGDDSAPADRLDPHASARWNRYAHRRDGRESAVRGERLAIVGPAVSSLAPSRHAGRT